MNWPKCPFAEVVQDVTGGNAKLQTRDYNENGALPIVDQGKTLIAGYTDELELAVKSEGPHVIFGDHTGIVKFVDFPFAIGADGTKVLKPVETLNAKYFYHFSKPSDYRRQGTTENSNT